MNNKASLNRKLLCLTIKKCRDKNKRQIQFFIGGNMLTGIFVLPGPLHEKEVSPQTEIFDACLTADIQYLHGCRNIADLFSKIENFLFQNQNQPTQLLAIIPPSEHLAFLLREVFSEINLIVWSREEITDDVFNNIKPMIAVRYHDPVDIGSAIQIIKQLITKTSS